MAQTIGAVYDGELFMTDVGKRIREIREEQHMRQADLAKELGVALNSVSRWEIGAALPDIRRLEQIADVLGVDAAELLRDPLKV